MLHVIVLVLVRPFTMFVLGRNTSMYTQHRTARIARQVGDSRRGLLYVFFLFLWSSAPSGISDVFFANCLGLALPPCGVESSCDTLLRARLEWRGPEPLFGCFWQGVFTKSGDASGDFRWWNLGEVCADLFL